MQNQKDDPILGDMATKETRESEKQADVESQVPATPAVGTWTTAIFLACYFLMNICLTFYNKAVLGSFQFPWILTAVHTFSAFAGCSILLLFGQFQLTRLTAHDNLTLFIFSLLFTLNIAMSNVSLAMVSVPFHQIMRATCPVFTIAIYSVLFGRKYAVATYLSLVPIIGGVGLATYGDYYFTLIGFVLTFLGVLLAAIKTVATNRLLTGRLQLGPLEVLLRMCPLAAIQSLLYSALIGEFSDFMDFVNTGAFDKRAVLALAGNGILAFALNVTSFQANKLAGALSMTVCANLKQCLTIVLGAILWDLRMSVTNGAGIAMALVGAAGYSVVELQNKRKVVRGG
ncbi:unnamed protein product [Periconia digitata]|uniref:Sugar phosphate transporter domain-containing protein n=1 Tax=Periconia digitata TaxID=1303443 RepID=A0A9W4XZD4_9PLEO|nr:unnamed protein product [Periconia digitata]